MAGTSVRYNLKRNLARLSGRRPAVGTTILVYHRIGGGTPDERDVSFGDFATQLDILAGHSVVSLDAALDALEAGDDAPRVVLTFDDGFADVHERAWPLLGPRGLPFTVYVATAYIGREMQWEGSTAQGGGLGLTWEQLAELAASPLCTIGNHTHAHPRPSRLSESEVDRCSEMVGERLGVRLRHFAYPWGERVPTVEPALRRRFRSVATGRVGRNRPGLDPMRLRRVPVRATDPPEFFTAKLSGRLLPERVYGALVTGGKALRVRPA